MGALTTYFLKSLIERRTRQGPLFLAAFGLFLASFSLIFLQSTMGGLQSKLMERSKRVVGHVIFTLDNADLLEVEKARQWLISKGVAHLFEYELEALLRHKDVVLPVIVHGVEKRPDFLPASLQIEELIVPFDLSYKARMSYGDRVEIIFPGLVDSFLEDIPRSTLISVQELFATDVPEIDGLHVWTKLSRVQNVVKNRGLNRLRLYQTMDDQELAFLSGMFTTQVEIKTWAQLHPTLVYALGLEAFMMVFLFAIMSLLVALSIVSGLLLLWNKLKTDMASFWLLGASRKKLIETPKIVVLFMSTVPTILGLGAGLVALLLLKKYGGNFMPDVFVDRNIPVLVTTRGVFLSLAIPMSMAFLFGLGALLTFKRNLHFIDLVRATGTHK